MSNLTPADIAAIEAIVKAQLEHYGLLHPTAKDEVIDYIKCVRFNGTLKEIIIGKIYQVKRYLEGCGAYIYIGDSGEYTFLANCDYVSSTLSAYIAQQQGEWKVGDWAWADKGKNTLGVITKVYGQFADINTQTEKLHTITGLWHEEFTKPTEQEIFLHLKAIAEKKGFRAGVKINQQWIKLKTNDAPIGNEEPKLISDEIFWVGNICVWYKGVWAEIVEDVKERFELKFGDRYYTIELVGTGIDIRQRMWAEKASDFNNSKLGNCFKTEAEATEIADKIKALLKG